jgi:flagellar protein FlaJ
MPLNKYQKICYRWFGRIAEQRVHTRLKADLEAAHINMRAGAYLSVAWLNTILATIVSMVVMINLVFFILPVLNVELQMFFQIMLLLLPLLIGFLSYFVFLSLPTSNAKARGKRIDRHLPYALNFISAMSSAGVTPTEIFKSLAKQDIYGEIKEESSWIYRDVTLLGKDILTSIKDNVERTPSQKFKEFLQGLVVTVTSGGSLKSYFMVKADQLMRENRQEQKQLIEGLGIMAEAYVTAAVAGVLLMMIVLTLMIVITGASEHLTVLYFFIIVIPVINGVFAWVVSSMTQGA